MENILRTIIDSYNINEYYNYVTSYKLISDHSIVSEFISSYILRVSDLPHSYKNQDKTKHLFEIFNLLLLNKLSPNHMTIYVENIIITIGCQNILKKIDLSKYNTFSLIRFLCLASKKGSYPNFYIMYNYIKKNDPSLLSNLVKKECIANTFMNTDDRLYKNVMNEIMNTDDRLYKNLMNEILLMPEDFEQIINNIFSIGISDKYILRRLKFLSKKYDISPYSTTIIHKALETDHSLELIRTIFDFYYTTQLATNYIKCLVFKTLSFEPIDINIITFYNILKSNLEKNTFIMTILPLYNINLFKLKINCDEDIPSVHLLREILYSKNINACIDIIKFYPSKDIIKIMSSHCRLYYCFFLLPLIRYFSDNVCRCYCDTICDKYTVEKIVKLNRCLLELRLYIRRVKKNSSINKKLKIIPILNELKYLKPSIKPIFKDGTNFFKNNKQCFNNIPPYHIYPGQLQTLNNYLLREKADGVLVHSLPSNIYPPFPPKNKIKAEYIESLDLYLVFDIDIPMNIMDRYNYLRDLHPYSIPTTTDDLVIMLDRERENVRKFLNEPHQYRWYPKAAWEIKHKIDFTIILNSQDTCKLLDGPIKTDGFIITPLNGNREIKIKPKYLMTIDLLYLNGWFDRNGYQYNIQYNEADNNTIWRCYPVSGGYEAREIRFDKLKPNTRKVVQFIMNMASIEYKNNYPSIYRDKFTTSESWNEIVKTTNIIIAKMIKKLPCSNILDLGCGNGKLLKYTKFKNYHGVDLDINMLARAIDRYESDNITFNYLDLSKEWNGWYSIDACNELGYLGARNLEKIPLFDSTLVSKDYPAHNRIVSYDTVIAINSLQHFCSDIFWEQLNKVATNMMLFNLVDMENTCYNFDDSYIKRSDNVVSYYFSSVHTKEMTEPYIEIKYFLDKYGWKIIEEYRNETLLYKYYKWYIIQKI
jgi:SAM-dependent methyltransferase